MAPQIQQGLGYDIQADVYSLGVILYQLVMGDLPFKAWDQKSLLKEKLTAKPNFTKVRISDELRDLITRMLISNPKERITFIEVYQHKLWKKQEGKNDLIKSIGNYNLSNKSRIAFQNYEETYKSID